MWRTKPCCMSSRDRAVPRATLMSSCQPLGMSYRPSGPIACVVAVIVRHLEVVTPARAPLRP